MSAPAPAPTYGEEYYSLKNVQITLQTGVVVDATEIQISRDLEIAERTAGGSKTEQGVVVKEKRPKITIKGYNTTNLMYGQLVPRTPITAFDVKSLEAGTPSIFDTNFFDLWPIDKMILGKTDTTLGEKPSEWSTEVLAGIVNAAEGITTVVQAE